MEFQKTREFERMICEYTGAKYCSVLPNGTISLTLALMALGIGEGDEVIVPDYTMIATPNSVLLAKAKPIFVDINKSLCMDVKAIKKAITPKTKAIIHVSINGRSGDLGAIKELCKKKNIMLIEDAAQALGSFYKKRHLGRHGIIGSFSFSTPKVITTGQGGAVVTDNKKIYEKVLKLKDFGRVRSGVDSHDQIGWNFKFTDLQAVFGIEQMKKLSWRVKRKKAIYSLYEKLLKNVKEVEFVPTNLKEVSPWFIDILVPDPAYLHDYLKLKGIGARPFYPAIHKQPIYKRVKGDFPMATQAGSRGLWLPSSSSLKDSDIKFICKEIREFYK